jgi:predicted transcriptional regulator
MRTAKVQSLRALRDEMKAVARGERRAPSDASRPSFNSIEAVVRLLTPDNRRLLALPVRRGDRLSVLPMHGNESELPKFLVAKIKKQLGLE